MAVHTVSSWIEGLLRRMIGMSVGTVTVKLQQKSGLMAPTLHVWASGSQNDGAFGWTAAATTDIANASKKHEASAQKEFAKLKEVGTKVLRAETAQSDETILGSAATPLGIGLGVVALMAFRHCAEVR